MRFSQGARSAGSVGNLRFGTLEVGHGGWWMTNTLLGPSKSGCGTNYREETCTYTPGSKQCTVQCNEIFNNITSSLFSVGFRTVFTPQNWLFSTHQGIPAISFWIRKTRFVILFIDFNLGSRWRKLIKNNIIVCFPTWILGNRPGLLINLKFITFPTMEFFWSFVISRELVFHYLTHFLFL
jgi:hypothetical protein